MGDPNPIIGAYRASNPEATPWDLYILIATDHPRGTYTRELAKRKVAQGSASVYVYRFDWETPEGGGHMRSPHAVEVPFVFEDIKVAGPLISKGPRPSRSRKRLPPRGSPSRARETRIHRRCPNGRGTR